MKLLPIIYWRPEHTRETFMRPSNWIRKRPNSRMILLGELKVFFVLQIYQVEIGFDVGSRWV